MKSIGEIIGSAVAETGGGPGSGEIEDFRVRFWFSDQKLKHRSKLELKRKWKIFSEKNNFVKFAVGEIYWSKDILVF